MTVYLAMVFTLPRVTDLFENLLKAMHPLPAPEVPGGTRQGKALPDAMGRTSESEGRHTLQ